MSNELRFLPPANWLLEGGSGRQPASSINRQSLDERTASIVGTARSQLTALLYGRRDVVGQLGPQGRIGGDYVVSFIWGIGPWDAIESVYLRDQPLPAGVLVKHYLGTPEQGVDPWLAAAVAGYNDRMRIPTRGGYRGVVYTVLRIPAAVEQGMEGYPEVRAVARGLANVRDPRDDSVGYSDNPALCLANYIEDADFGLASPVVGGLEACASWCDSLLGGVLPRCRIGKLVIDARPARDHAQMLAEYAECFFVEEGEGFRLIPDAPVDLDATPIITADQLAGTSLSLDSMTETGSPTEVTVQYTEPGESAGQPWALEPADPSALPGVAEGDVSRIPTSVTLDGITRYEEAKNKADSRLARQQNRLRVSWRGFDAGVLYQPGDVVRMQWPAFGVELLPVRITGVSISGAGRHGFTAERYDPLHYPSDLTPPGEQGIVPVGVIALLLGNNLPDGWADFTDANGRYVRCAGDDVPPGSTGGQATVTVAGTTTADGAHGPGAGTQFAALSYRAGGSGWGRPYYSAGDVGQHAHAVPAAELTPALYTRRCRLVQKISAADNYIPPSVAAFAPPNFSAPNVERIVSHAGRLLSAAAAHANSGRATQTVTLTTAGASDAHDHYTGDGFGFSPATGLFLDKPASSHGSGGGPHTHNASLTLSHDIRRARMPLWGSGSDWRVYPGVIFLWAGSPEDLPEGYYVCDGQNGTPDLRGRFIEFAGAEDTEIAYGGNNTVRVHGYTAMHSHGHIDSTTTTEYEVESVGHGSHVQHRHHIDITADFEPVYYSLAAIMYVPGES